MKREHRHWFHVSLTTLVAALTLAMAPSNPRVLCYEADGQVALEALVFSSDGTPICQDTPIGQTVEAMTQGAEPCPSCIDVPLLVEAARGNRDSFREYVPRVPTPVLIRDRGVSTQGAMPARHQPLSDAFHRAIQHQHSLRTVVLLI